MLIALVLGYSGNIFAQKVHYVNASASGQNDGSTWENAYVYLQDALTVALAGDEIWISEGLYKPDMGALVQPGDRNASFKINEGITIYGGFSGVENSIEERNIERNKTILSGDLSENDPSGITVDSTSMDNSFHVVEITSIDLVKLSDLWIEKGNASQPDNTKLSHYGGGILIRDQGALYMSNIFIRLNTALQCGGGVANFGELRVENSTFQANSAFGKPDTYFCGGGAIYHNPSNNNALLIEDSNFLDNLGQIGGAISSFSSPVNAIRSKFINNTSEVGGGVLLRQVETSSGDKISTFLNSYFANNKATGQGGGAIFIERSHANLHNSIFSGNAFAPQGRFTEGGAVVAIENSKLQVVNSSFYGNLSISASAIYGSASSLIILNSIIWGNSNEDLGKGSIVLHQPLEVEIKNSISDTTGLSNYIHTSTVISEDPSWIDPDGKDNIVGTLDDDLRISKESLAINSGNNSFLPKDIFDLDNDQIVEESLPIDIAGNNRIFGLGIVDMGAYEYNKASTSRAYFPKKEETPIYIFPHPCHTTCTIWSEEAMSKLEIYDLQGRLIASFTANNLSKLSIDVSYLNKGLYAMRIGLAGNRSYSITLVVI